MGVGDRAAAAAEVPVPTGTEPAVKRAARVAASRGASPRARRAASAALWVQPVPWSFSVTTASWGSATGTWPGTAHQSVHSPPSGSPPVSSTMQPRSASAAAASRAGSDRPSRASASSALGVVRVAAGSSTLR